MKIIFYSFIFLLMISLVNASICYQETANETSVCGGLDTGGYLCSGIWADPQAACSMVYDANWTSAGWGLAGNTGYLEINYTKPTNATVSSLWQVADISGTDNLTINQTCWDYDANQLLFRGYVSDGGNTGVWQCYNGSWLRCDLLGYK